MKTNNLFKTTNLLTIDNAYKYYIQSEVLYYIYIYNI